jgi:site-specific recombinase XerD
VHELEKYEIKLPAVQVYTLEMPAICKMVQSDADMINEYLFRADLDHKFKLSDSTISYYAKEFRRLACYCRLRQVTFQDITYREVLEYVEFLKRPPEILVGNKRPANHKNWKPFEKSELSASSLKQAIKPIASLWRSMQDDGYVQQNPWAKLSLSTDRSRNEQQLRRLRIIPRAALTIALDWLDFAGTIETYDQRRIARCRWLFCLYLFSGARLSDAIKHTASAFEQAGDVWVFNHTSKGRASHSTPIPKMLINEYHQYIHSMDLVPNNHCPLVYSLSGKLPITDRSTIHGEMKYVLGEAAKYAKEKGDAVSESKLAYASTHWLKHSFVSLALDVSNGNIRLVTDLARHADWKTTKSYDHSDIREMSKITNDMAEALGRS